MATGLIHMQPVFPDFPGQSWIWSLCPQKCPKTGLLSQIWNIGPGPAPGSIFLHLLRGLSTTWPGLAFRWHCFQANYFFPLGGQLICSQCCMNAAILINSADRQNSFAQAQKHMTASILLLPSEAELPSPTELLCSNDIHWNSKWYRPGVRTLWSGWVQAGKVWPSLRQQVIRWPSTDVPCYPAPLPFASL